MKSFKYLTAGLTAVALAGGISLVYAQSNARMDSTNNTATQTADPQRDGTMQSGTASRPYNSNDTTAGTSSSSRSDRTMDNSGNVTTDRAGGMTDRSANRTTDRSGNTSTDQSGGMTTERTAKADRN